MRLGFKNELKQNKTDLRTKHFSTLGTTPTIDRSTEWCQEIGYVRERVGVLAPGIPPWILCPLSWVGLEASWRDHLHHRPTGRTVYTEHNTPLTERVQTLPSLQCESLFVLQAKQIQEAVNTNQLRTFLSKMANAASAALEVLWSSAPPGVFRTGEGDRTLSFWRFWIFAQRSMSFMI